MLASVHRYRSERARLFSATGYRPGNFAVGQHCVTRLEDDGQPGGTGSWMSGVEYFDLMDDG